MATKRRYGLKHRTQKKTPVLLLEGYLGAGKTTLLNYILQQTDRKVAILMNEFGAIGIDTQEIQGHHIAVKELLEGCVCCSLRGELEAGLRELIDKYHPEQIIIETTGIAEADNLVVEIDQDFNFVQLDAVITIVDAEILKRFPEIRGSAEVQIKAADLLVLNKIDLVHKKDLPYLQQRLRTINSRASIIKTSYGQVDVSVLLSVEADHAGKKDYDTYSSHTGSSRQTNTHYFHKHDHTMDSFILSVGVVNMRKFRTFLEQLPAKVFRVKGYIRSQKKYAEQYVEQCYLVQFVAGRFSITKATSKNPRLVFIGEHILQSKHEIGELLESTVVKKVARTVNKRTKAF